ncbi:MAG: glycosyltransferase [Candidatus Eisenbacteria bacterium]|nr:glycosyltransferase [Candidatus Eisenbacteria bacterium]
MRRKRILIFAYFFPPLGGAGVQRIVKFAKYLPQRGWDPTIVTVRARDYWMHDATLERELGSDVRVVRTASLTGLGVLRRLAPGSAGGPDAPRASSGGIRRLRRLAGWFWLPDSYRGWVPFAVRAGADLLARESFDALLTSSSPDSSHLIGLALARRFRVPWVADFRDPWTRRISFDPPTRWHHRWHRSTERRVLRRADLVTVTAPETREDYLAREPGLAPERIRVITNGFDEADFAGLEGAAPDPARLRILHAGQLNTERPARPFLDGLARFLEETPSARVRLRADFIGAHYAEDRDDARRLGLEDVVRFARPLPHRELVAELRASHLLLLMEQDSSRGALILPGKIFEYLRARRPILGLLPEGAAAHLIRRLGAGWCCRTGDAACAARLLAERFAAFSRGAPFETALGEADLAPFERRALTAELAEALDDLPTRRLG